MWQEKTLRKKNMEEFQCCKKQHESSNDKQILLFWGKHLQKRRVLVALTASKGWFSWISSVQHGQHIGSVQQWIFMLSITYHWIISKKKVRPSHLQGAPLTPFLPSACGMADMFRSNFGSKVLAQHSAAIGPTPWLVALGASQQGLRGGKFSGFLKGRWLPFLS